jgi:hypothetical protein
MYGHKMDPNTSEACVTSVGLWPGLTIKARGGCCLGSVFRIVGGHWPPHWADRAPFGYYAGSGAQSDGEPWAPEYGLRAVIVTVCGPWSKTHADLAGTTESFVAIKELLGRARGLRTFNWRALNPAARPPYRGTAYVVSEGAVYENYEHAGPAVEVGDKGAAVYDDEDHGATEQAAYADQVLLILGRGGEPWEEVLEETAGVPDGALTEVLAAALRHAPETVGMRGGAEVSLMAFHACLAARLIYARPGAFRGGKIEAGPARYALAAGRA